MSRTALLDIAERVLSTYIQAFLGILLATVAFDQGSFEVGALKAAAVAALPAALSLVKNILATGVRSPISPASLVPDAVSGVG